MCEMRETGETKETKETKENKRAWFSDVDNFEFSDDEFRSFKDFLNSPEAEDTFHNQFILDAIRGMDKDTTTQCIKAGIGFLDAIGLDGLTSIISQLGGSVDAREYWPAYVVANYSNGSWDECIEYGIDKKYDFMEEAESVNFLRIEGINTPLGDAVRVDEIPGVDSQFRSQNVIMMVGKYSIEVAVVNNLSFMEE